MPSFFDRFRDLDDLKARAESLLQETLSEGRRQAALAKLRVRILDLERRMNAEFRVLGERVWELHQVGALTGDNLAGAFDKLEALADDIAAARDEIEDLARQPDDEDDEDGPVDDRPPMDDERTRRIENEPDGTAPLE